MWLIIPLLLILQIALQASDFVEIQFSDFIRFVSSETDENYILDNGVNDKISVFLPTDYESKDTRTILDEILKNNDLIISKVNSINYITKIKKPVMYAYDTQYINPNLAISLLEKNFKDINFNYVNKRIIYESTSENYERINTFLKLVDVPILSRNLKINLIYFNTDDLREFGAQIQTGDNDSFQFKSFVNQLTSFQQLNVFNNTSYVNLYFKDLRENNLVEFKFSPIVTLFNGNDTLFDIVKNIPYIKQESQSSSTVQTLNSSYDYRDVGTKIEIKDVSITDDEIYFKINLVYEMILDSSLTPKTSKRFISNYVKIKKGESILISGLSSDEYKNNSIEVPILAKIPYLGDLFTYEYESKNNETFAIYIEDIDDATGEVNASKRGPASAGK